MYLLQIYLKLKCDERYKKLSSHAERKSMNANIKNISEIMDTICAIITEFLFKYLATMAIK